MIEKGNVDRFELPTFYSTIDALAIELRISIYTSIAIQPYLKTHTTFASSMSLKKDKIFYKTKILHYL